MSLRRLCGACLMALAAGGALAQGALDDATAAARLIADSCVTQSLDFPAIFDAAASRAADGGLAQVMNDGNAAMFGNPGAAHLTFNRRVDSMHCALNLPASDGLESDFAIYRDVMDAAILAAYPGALSDPMEYPSPHQKGHQWVFSVPKDRHFATSLDWTADRGLTLAVGYSQRYD
jgi:hypothetical protein